ncbi:uncharacterized protein LAESUDRAFT_723044 [Laetiporus sulphureus 93-53]|uniref:Ubiquitin-like 1-activating enzyme E1A n=1 Tax=Laetiporus sulphureus 93-53 TaxID=1314785 RepID=A0A165FQ75_9APHY|nr:uncharacterized protein LAESUDRAFT_723044 [Laetiporus sulphureus 93-53]KZT09311.1 hypothetical protein LAESUDRAFT_723044 [Laetiporus sulphureus 93-53]
MATSDPSTKSIPLQITEDEAAVYDRQIRLWGLEAQQRMRNATILVVRLRGVATEAIKNIVLAGIGKLVLVDGDLVAEEDLGAGFFFRDDDVGKKKAEAAKARIESLNPLVTVETISAAPALEGDALDALVRDVDMVCVTDSDRETLIRVNGACRRSQKPFYAGGTYGLLGYIFCDLLTHDYIAPDRTASKDTAKNVKYTTTYCRLRAALGHRWTGLTRRQTRELNPAATFVILALWEYQAQHKGVLPHDAGEAAVLEQMANTLLSQADVNKQAMPSIPKELVETMAVTASHEMSPVCAVVGGMLAQDMLKALAARESPIVNFFVFDGHTGGGTVCRMNIP